MAVYAHFGRAGIFGYFGEAAGEAAGEQPASQLASQPANVLPAA